ncbi:MAG TPA: cold shock domain-containing protein [Thermodesulfobacteriota bacterium]|nr:cold shock domain-containing protein [Thermodesulfobacteriota bacterium]
MNGSIKRLFKDKGYGFIKAEDGRDIFFHRTGVDGTQFESLTEGQDVEFELERNPKGSRDKGPRAIRVRVKA